MFFKKYWLKYFVDLILIIVVWIFCINCLFRLYIESKEVIIYLNDVILFEL